MIKPIDHIIISSSTNLTGFAITISKTGIMMGRMFMR